MKTTPSVSANKQDYGNNAKEYIVGIKSRKLHKKNGCQYSRHPSDYYEFNTFQEVADSIIDVTYCHACFKEDPLKNIKPNKKKIKRFEFSKKDKPFKFLYVVFAILFSIIGFMTINDKIGGKIMGAILFIGIGLLIAFFVDLIINLTYRFIYMTTKKENDAHIAYQAYRKSTVAFIIKIVLCVLLGIFAVTREYGHYQPPKSKYEDVFEKNPNNWTDDEKEYVNDFFEWMEDN